MNNSLSQNLYITYSNQKARDLKQQKIAQPIDKVISLDTLILELFEKKNYEIIIDDSIALALIYKIIQNNKIEYFSYLNEDSVSLNTIYNFIIRCKRNDVTFDSLLNGKKLDALLEIDQAYQTFKKENMLVDIADTEQRVAQNFESWFDDGYSEIYIDSFSVGNISYIKSKKQEQIVKKLSKYSPINHTQNISNSPKLLQSSHEVFDNIDEIKTAIRIARKLLENGVNSKEILIVASDIQEYAPLYKLFLDEYAMKGFSSIGTPLSSFHNIQNQQVKIALSIYKREIERLMHLYKKLDLVLSETTKENLKNSITILDEKIGIEMTEPNQLVGLNREYKHIIFIGTDINHFPPKANDNFLYSYDDDLKYFYANNYFTSSQTQLDELKRVCENLYIITASYSGKRELSASILIDNEFDAIIDISDIKSISQLALEKSTLIPDEKTKSYYESIISEEFTKFDGFGVSGLEANHLSASQINKYLSCPLAYLYANKIKLKAPSQSEEGFDVMEQGSLMHLCYELFGKYIQENHIKTTDKEVLYKIMFDLSFEAYNHQETTKNRGDENIHHQIFLSTLQAGLQDERAAGLLAKFVNYYIDNAKVFKYFESTEFEKEFALDDDLKPYRLKDKEDTNYFIKGFIDRFDNLEDHLNVVDYKSTKVKSKDKQKQQDVEDFKDVQLALYILYAKQVYPNKTIDAHLLSFKGNDKGVKFASLSEIDDEELKVLINETKKKIEKGEFIFNNSDAKVCEWCDMKYICHESVLSKQKSER